MKVYKKDNKFWMEDNGATIELTPNEDNYLKLPTNSVNRVWVSGGKVEKAPGQYVDYGMEAKVPKVYGPRGSTTERKPIEDYLSDEDKATFLALLEKAKANKAEATKKAPMSDLEKAERALERAKARVEALSK